MHRHSKCSHTRVLSLTRKSPCTQSHKRFYSCPTHAHTCTAHTSGTLHTHVRLEHICALVHYAALGTLPPDEHECHVSQTLDLYRVCICAHTPTPRQAHVFTHFHACYLYPRGCLPTYILLFTCTKGHLYVLAVTRFLSNVCLKCVHSHLHTQTHTHTHQSQGSFPHPLASHLSLLAWGGSVVGEECGWLSPPPFTLGLW